MDKTNSIAAGVLLMAIAGCTTTGTGVGSTMTGDIRSTFSWTSKDGRSGVMTAQLSTGETYTGTYFQISRESEVETLGPLWAGWNSPWWRSWWGWGAWGDWGWGPNTRFVRTYSGRVVANLEGPNGAHMRCRFNLIRPSAGMSGGGQGSCQIPNGQTIDTSFPGK